MENPVSRALSPGPALELISQKSKGAGAVRNPCPGGLGTAEGTTNSMTLVSVQDEFCSSRDLFCFVFLFLNRKLFLGWGDVYKRPFEVSQTLWLIFVI